jgi:hypothetical protein
LGSGDVSSKTNALFFAKLLVERGMPGGGAEIGVFEGEFSRVLLDNWALGAPIHLVDLWNGTGRGGMKANAGHMRKAVSAVSRHDNRVVFHAKSSREAAALVEDDSLVFVYIDGDHSHMGCRDDLNLWWPKLKQHGLLAGHDYRHNCGVPNAVWEFSRRIRIPFTVVPEDETEGKPNALWYMFKD